jgi:acetylornithine/succinyldiaminopimelate/putrescine aminotransferase
MTPSISHKRFARALRHEVGQQRGGCPFDRFICMNSGSEAVTVACRISDINALHQVRPGGPREGQQVKFLVLRGAFHGRTDRPAQASHSTLPKYQEHLASFADRDNLIVVPPNDIEALRAAYAQAERDGVFIEMMLIEPVMGEGNPGQGLDRGYYDVARELTRAHGSLLLVDSIQAGIRGTGFLSLVDYPGFEDCAVPDLETWSKALNAGQYPMSVLGLSQRAADLYVRGVYGNTMTTNPRALEVGCAVLEGLTPELRENIRDRGRELVTRLQGLAREFPGVITRVQGTGLLLSAELDPERLQVVGHDGVETWCRRHGLGVIHGGKNALRFTPHFGITSEEVDLVVSVVRQALVAFVGLDPLEARGIHEPVAEVAER